MGDPHRAGESNHKRILLFDWHKVCLIMECMLLTSVEQISNKKGEKKKKRCSTFVYNQKSAVAQTNSTVNIIQVNNGWRKRILSRNRTSQYLYHFSIFSMIFFTSLQFSSNKNKKFLKLVKFRLGKKKFNTSKPKVESKSFKMYN